MLHKFFSVVSRNLGVMKFNVLFAVTIFYLSKSKVIHVTKYFLQSDFASKSKVNIKSYTTLETNISTLINIQWVN